MRHTISLASLLLFALPLVAADAPKLDDFAPHASGVALVEVVGVKRYDERSTDGNKGVRFKLERVRGSGEFWDTVDVVTEFGGFRGGEVPKPSHPVKVDSLKKGERYWFAFSSEHEHQKYNQGVIGFWPEKDAKAEALEAAEKADTFRWHPQYDPETKLTYGRVSEKGKWHVRVEKGGKVLWEKEIPGAPVDGCASWGLWDNTGDDFVPKFPACGKLLIAQTATALDKDNEYGLPAGPYHVTTGFDPESGTRYAAWVYKAEVGGVELVRRAYDPPTAKPTREERFESPRTGGKAVGAKTDDWLKKTARTFDPKTGKVTKEEVFRHDQCADPNNRWIKITP